MTDRAAFEEWALRELKQDASNWKHPSGEYVYLESEWKAWQEAVRLEREAAAKVVEAMRDDHCAGTKKSPYKSDWCEHDDQCCEFVVAWNEAAAAIRVIDRGGLSRRHMKALREP